MPDDSLVLSSIEVKCMKINCRTIDEIIVSRFEYQNRFTHTTVEEAFLLEQRISGNTLKYVSKFIDSEILSASLDVSSSRLRQLYRHKYITKSHSEIVSDLTDVWAEANEVFRYNHVILKEWLGCSIPALNHRSPLDIIISVAGRSVLRTLLNNLRFSDFS